jgi:hypothetical protein
MDLEAKKLEVEIVRIHRIRRTNPEFWLSLKQCRAESMDLMAAC